eukprot:1803414-Pyramimonas_sp.AAC.1
MLKEAAREVRDMLFTLKAESDETAIIVARSCARAIWRQDVPLARRLISTSQWASDALLIEGPQ